MFAFFFFFEDPEVQLRVDAKKQELDLLENTVLQLMDRIETLKNELRKLGEF